MTDIMEPGVIYTRKRAHALQIGSSWRKKSIRIEWQDASSPEDWILGRTDRSCVGEATRSGIYDPANLGHDTS